MRYEIVDEELVEQCYELGLTTAKAFIFSSLVQYSSFVFKTGTYVLLFLLATESLYILPPLKLKHLKRALPAGMREGEK